MLLLLLITSILTVASGLIEVRRPLKAHQGYMRLSELPLDLHPEAQSYFITPEPPLTTTTKATFTRRRTHIPTFSTSTTTTEGSVISTQFNPFRMIVDTSFVPQNNKKQLRKKSQDVTTKVNEESNNQTRSTTPNHFRNNRFRSINANNNNNNNANKPASPVSSNSRRQFVLRPKDNANQNASEQKPIRKRRKMIKEQTQTTTKEEQENNSLKVLQNPFEASSQSQENQNQSANNTNRRRKRPIRNRSGSLRSSQSRSLPLDAESDSFHQSSDTVPVIAVIPKKESNTTNPEFEPLEVSPPPAPGYIPRNLSNRNPIDKLNNRQAARNRFLTPKKTETEIKTTPTPETVQKVSRKSPFSLQNLRNRRIGTTVAPLILSSPAEEETEDTGETALPISVHNNSTQPIEIEVKEIEVKNPEPMANEEISPLKKPTRPLLRPLGSRPASQPRPLLKSTVSTTTKKPEESTTTTAPVTCENGKRYNKILRKCIPNFTRMG